MLATLSIAFTHQAEASHVLPPAEQQRVAQVLEDDIARINTDVRPLALQVALLIPLLGALLGLFNSFRMVRLAAPEPSGSGEAIALA